MEIRKGEIHCLAGENGCGKSTLIKIISGVYRQDSGTIEIDGTVYDTISPTEAIKQGVQVIYQDLSVFPNLTVMENLALSMELAGNRKIVNYKRLREIAKQAIASVNYKVDLDVKVDSLSIADKQMVAICRSLLYNAKLIIMDEPTSSLTQREVGELFKVIRKLQANGIAILFVSHKLDEVFEISERFTIFRNGEKVIDAQTNELDDEKFAYYMTGRKFEDNFFDGEILDEEPILKVKGLSRTPYFKNISFELRRGEILGITGLIGCGRDELMLSLFGMMPAEDGQVFMHGREVILNSVSASMKQGIGYVPPDRIGEGLFLSLSIQDNLIAAKLKKMTKLFRLLDQKKITAEAGKWIEEFSVVAKDSKSPVQTLSGGNQQKVVLARWLATDLSVLILNGPTVGVDIGAKYDIYHILKDLAKTGLAIIIVSDDLPEVLTNCNRILILKKGEISGEITPREVNKKQLGDMITSVE